jgi:hypothetical protein
LRNTWHSAGLTPKIETRWNELQKAGNFEEGKALLSLLALPANLEMVKPRSIEQALDGSTPALSTVNKYQGREVSKDAVIQIIAEAAALLNIGKNLQPHQIEFLAEDILQDWFYLTIGEIRYIMQQGIRNRWGNIYDRLDVETVMGWIGQYDAIRTDMVERRAQKAAEAEKTDRATPMPDSLKQLAEDLAPKSCTVPEFVPDAPFEEMIKQEWSTLPDAYKEGLDFLKFRKMRIEYTKTLLKRGN